jgi:hypothetical protein
MADSFQGIITTLTETINAAFDPIKTEHANFSEMVERVSARLKSSFRLRR